MLEKLKKIKGRNLAELKERGLQGANVFAERVGASSQTKLPSDEKLLEKFNLIEKIVTIESLLKHFRSRDSVKFYSSFDDSQATIAALRKRFPYEEIKIIERADRICEGILDLLGYENLYFNGKIPDWHYDPISRKSSPRIHWSSNGDHFTVMPVFTK